MELTQKLLPIIDEQSHGKIAIAVFALLFVGVLCHFAFLIFEALLCALVPKLASQSNALPLSLRIAGGLSVIAFCAALCAHVHILNEWSVLCGCCLYVFLFLRHSKYGTRSSHYIVQLKAKFTNLSKGNVILISLLSLHVVPKWFEALVPNGHGDPLYYHIYSAWEWAKAGKFFFDDWQPMFLQGGVFEYLYGLIAVVTGDPMTTLITGQVLHATASLPISIFIFYNLCKMIGMNQSFSLVASLAFVCISRDPLTVIRAKNDGFVMMLGLCFFYCLAYSFHFRKKKMLMLGSWYAAAALATKSTALLFLVPSFSVIPFVFYFRRMFMDIKEFSLISFVLLSGTFVLWRNYFFTHNPFYPALSQIFPSPLMNSDIAMVMQNYTAQNSHLIKDFLGQIRGFVQSKFLFIFALLGFAPAWKRGILWLYFIFIGTVLLTAKMGGSDSTSDRFSLTLLALWSIFSLLFLQSLEKHVRKSRQLVSSAALIIFGFAISLVNSGYEIPASRLFRIHAPFWLSSQTLMDFLKTERPFIRLTSVINSKVTEGKILSNSTNEGLFLKVPIVLNNNEIRANRIFNAKSADEFKELMKIYGFSAVIVDLANDVDNNRRPAFSDVLTQFNETARDETFLLLQP